MQPRSLRRSAAGRGRRLPVLALGGALLVLGLAVVAVLAVRAQRAGAAVIATDAASHLHVLLVDPADPRHLLLGQHSGLVESHDGGTVWAWAAGPLGHGMLTVLAAAGPHALYAAGVRTDGETPLGLWRSPDGGKTWRKVHTPSAAVTTIAVAPGHPATLYVAAFHGGFFATTNGGATWRRLAGNLQDQGLSSLAVDPHDPAHVLAGTVGGLYDTDDGGRAWHAVPALRAQLVAAVAFAPWAGATAYAGSDNRLLRSDDSGRTWHAVGAAPRDVVALSAIDVGNAAGSATLAGTTTGLYAVTAAGTWMALGTGTLPAATVAVLARDPLHDDTIYAGYSFPSRLYRTADGGARWTKLAGP
jgi:photosystem II stability/assembly factor-like uncharacterized protein